MDREAIARLIDPVAFDAWQSLYDYGLTTAKFTPENALACANKFHGEERDAALAKADAILALTPPPGASPNPQEAEGWLPIVLCPTDGVNRALLLPDGEEVVGSFGEPSNRWRVWRASIPIPSRPLEPIGGVLRETAPYRMRVVSDLPTNVYPTHFRPNDTVFGRPASPTPQEAQAEESGS